MRKFTIGISMEELEARAVARRQRRAEAKAAGPIPEMLDIITSEGGHYFYMSNKMPFVPGEQGNAYYSSLFDDAYERIRTASQLKAAFNALTEAGSPEHHAAFRLAATFDEDPAVREAIRSLSPEEFEGLQQDAFA